MTAITPITKQRLAYTVDKLAEFEVGNGRQRSSILLDMPSVTVVKEILKTLRQLLFPLYNDNIRSSGPLGSHHIGVGVDRLFVMLQSQIEASMNFTDTENLSQDVIRSVAEDKASKVIEVLPSIREWLYTDIKSVFNNDPAVKNVGEVIFCYPSIRTMMNYRFAHVLYEQEVPLLPRIITEIAHSQTGIDIHPGARIGKYFSIDHGTGVVIGETCIIGNHVAIYQGVTLGAKSFSLDSEGHPVNLPRHPIIEDNVTVYSNATVLGRITIGHDSIIGGNVWLTHDVPPYSKILQGRNQSETFCDGAGI